MGWRVQRPETRARARALQLLYAWDLLGEPPLTTVARQLARGGVPAATLADAVALASRAAAGRAEFDRRVTAASDHWRLERLGIVERNILRLALAELSAGDTPPRVVIDEAIKLAQWFAGSKAPAFVNGVLDRVARDSGRL